MDPFCGGGLVVCKIEIDDPANPIKRPLCIPVCWEKNAASYVKMKLNGAIKPRKFSLEMVGQENPYQLILDYLERKGDFTDIRGLLRRARDVRQPELVSIFAYLVLLDGLQRKDLIPIVTVSVEVTESTDFDYISSIAVGFLAFKGNKDWRLLDRYKVKELHDTLQRKTWETCLGASARRDSLLRLFRLPK